MKVILVKKLLAMGMKLVAIGTASWYGPGLFGNPTSSGEPLTAYKATCAIPNFAGRVYRVLVVNLQNGRRTYCRVNDRGPVKSLGRVIDLSKETKRRLGAGDLTQVAIFI